MSNYYQSWTEADVRRHNERVASGRNAKADRVPSSPFPEPALCNGPLAAAQGKGGYTGRSLVSITSLRCKLLDPDNLAPKWFIDSLRYCGVIPNDRSEDIELTVRQVKVKTKAEEKTIVEVRPL